jgi:lauroyl/myristoyl acyltransferase
VTTRARYFAAALLMRAGLHLASLPRNLELVDRLARGYAWLARRTDSHILPRHIVDFPRRFMELVGDEFSPPVEVQRLMEERLLYRMRDMLLRQALTSRQAHDVLAHIEVGGREHLDAAFARGRGTIVMTAHFGFPYLIRPLLESYGARLPTARWESRRNVWSRAAALHGARTALEQNEACLFLPDFAYGFTCSVPFFGQRIPVGLAAFDLASRVGSPILPCSTVIMQRPHHFRLEFLPPLTLDASLGRHGEVQAVHEFVSHIQAWVKRYPSHLWEWALRMAAA